jgi:hypothetical protein
MHTIIGTPRFFSSTPSPNGNIMCSDISIDGTLAPISLCELLSNGSTYSCQKRSSATRFSFEMLMLLIQTYVYLWLL